MTKEQVKAKETAKYLSAKNDEMDFSATLDGDPFLITYYFKDNKLYQCVATYSQNHTNKEYYYEKFLTIAGKMDEKYGDHEDYTNWRSDLFKDDPKNYGLAASRGDVIFRYRWQYINTKIMLAMTGDNYEITLGAVYTDVKYKPSDKTDF